MGVNELAAWLIDIEHRAGNLYRGAAQVFTDDKRLAGFLRHLAEEEEHHGIVMGKIAEYVRNNRDMASAIALDRITRDKIEAPLLDCAGKMGSNLLQRKDIIDCIVAAEFSEWNDIFVYVLNVVKDAGSDFTLTAKIMQTHRRHVERFIESLPGGEVHLPMMRRLPAVWQPRILIAEDDHGVRDFLSAILASEGDVETAGNEALDKTRGRHFDVILSDVDMPVMNGLQFFTEASRLDPAIGARFLFMTGNPREEIVEFMRKNRLRYLQKPMEIHELEREVGDLLEREQDTARGHASNEEHRNKN